MTENQTIKERLISFIKFLEIGQGKFEANCGLANGYVNNIRRSVTPEKLQQIALRYPELNTGWLMTGEGEMLKPTVTQQTSGDNSPNFNGSKNINGNQNTIADSELLDKALSEISEMRIALVEAMRVNQDNTKQLLTIVQNLTAHHTV